MNSTKKQNEINKILEAFLNNSKKSQKENIYIIESYGKKLGEGSGGVIYEVKCKKSHLIFAGKLILNKTENYEERLGLMKELRGYNIIRIVDLITKKVENQKYTMILMERTKLKDLGVFTKNYWNNYLLKLINYSFDEYVGDNLLRFYTKQIVDSLEILHRNNLIHFDLKPENLLLTSNLTIKLSDFSLLTKVPEKKKFLIPGGTPGYVTREFYDKELMSKEDLEKQDYFSLGSTLFYLKYGRFLLDYENYNDSTITQDRITEILHKGIEYIQSRPVNDFEFKKFLLGLIQYNANERLNFKQIYRNKWLNRNLDFIKSIMIKNDNDDEKLLMELQKSDFLYMKEIEKKEKILTHKKYVFKIRKRHLIKI